MSHVEMPADLLVALFGPQRFVSMFSEGGATSWPGSSAGNHQQRQKGTVGEVLVLTAARLSIPVIRIAAASLVRAAAVPRCL